MPSNWPGNNFDWKIIVKAPFVATLNSILEDGFEMCGMKASSAERAGHVLGTAQPTVWSSKGKVESFTNC